MGSWPLFTCDWICTFRDKNYCALGTVQRYDEFMVRPTEKLLVYRCSLDCSGRTRGVPGGPKAPLCATPEPGQCPAPKSSQSLETLLDDRERPTAPVARVSGPQAVRRRPGSGRELLAGHGSLRPAATHTCSCRSILRPGPRIGLPLRAHPPPDRPGG